MKTACITWKKYKLYTTFISHWGTDLHEVFSNIVRDGIIWEIQIKKQENYERSYVLEMIYKIILPTYLILGIPYWIYFDCFLNKMNIGQVFIEISLISFITKGNRRFWFIGLILGLYLFSQYSIKITYKNVNEWNRGRRNINTLLF